MSGSPEPSLRCLLAGECSCKCKNTEMVTAANSSHVAKCVCSRDWQGSDFYLLKSTNSFCNFSTYVWHLPVSPQTQSASREHLNLPELLLMKSCLNRHLTPPVLASPLSARSPGSRHALIFSVLPSIPVQQLPCKVKLILLGNSPQCRPTPSCSLSSASGCCHECNVLRSNLSRTTVSSFCCRPALCLSVARNSSCKLSTSHFKRATARLVFTSSSSPESLLSEKLSADIACARAFRARLGSIDCRSVPCLQFLKICGSIVQALLLDLL